jgi:acyl-CoA dehydrogenase
MSVFSTFETMFRGEEPQAYEFVTELSAQLNRHAAAADADGQVPQVLIDAFGVESLNIALVPIAHGGRGSFGSLRRRLIANYWLGKGDPALAIALPGPSLASPPMCVLASHEQKQSFYRQFVGSSEPVWAAFALTEAHGGSDAAGLRTQAVRQPGGGWRLSGNKQYIGNAFRARQAVVFATVDERVQRFGIRAFLVDLDDPRVTVEPHSQMLGLRCVQLSKIKLDGVEVGDDRLLQDPQRTRQVDAFEGAQGAWDFMRPSLSTMICGAATRALDELLRATQPAAQTPAVAGLRAVQRERALALREAVDTALGVCFRAAAEFDHDRASSTLGSAAKALAATAALDVADLLLSTQSLFAQALDPSFVDRYIRNARAFDILEGTGEMQRLMVARQVGAQRSSRFSALMCRLATARPAATPSLDTLVTTP